MSIISIFSLRIKHVQVCILSLYYWLTVLLWTVRRLCSYGGVMWLHSPHSMGLNQSRRQWDWNWLMLYTAQHYSIYTIPYTPPSDDEQLFTVSPSLSLSCKPGSNNWGPTESPVIRQISGWSGSGPSRQLWIVETVISYQHWRLGTLRVQSEVEIFSFPADWLAAIATTPRWDSFVSFEKLSVKDFHGWTGPDYQNIYLNCHNILSLKRELVKTSSVL